MSGAAYLKRGTTYDPEDHRMTYRLGKARAILKGMGIEPTIEHDVDSDKSPLHREYGCNEFRCKSVWPVWVTDKVFELAYALANEAQTRMGEYHRAEAWKLHEAKQRS